MTMRRRLGQHFLHDGSAARRMLAALRTEEEDVIIEVGPGRGALTLPLGRACKKNGCCLLAIEKDPALAHEAERKIEDAGLASVVQIVRGDALRVLTSYVLCLTSPYKLIGNIPYYLTGALLRMIGELEPKPARAVLTVQREVAERITARPPRMNLLAAAVQFWANPRIVQFIAPSSFSPPPNVSSATILLVRRGDRAAGDLKDRYYRLIRALFKQPRKTAANNLVAGLRMQKDGAEMLLRAHGVSPHARPQDISFRVLINLASSLEPRMIY